MQMAESHCAAARCDGQGSFKTCLELDIASHTITHIERAEPVTLGSTMGRICVLQYAFGHVYNRGVGCVRCYPILSTANRPRGWGVRSSLKLHMYRPSRARGKLRSEACSPYSM